jgi:hypothetical protein
MKAKLIHDGPQKTFAAVRDDDELTALAGAEVVQAWHACAS